MQKKFNFFTALISLMLALHSKAQNFTQQQTQSEQLFDTSIGNINWRDFFTDPTLQDLIDRTFKGNSDLQLAIKNIDQEKAYVKQARANSLPELSAGATASRELPSNNTPVG